MYSSTTWFSVHSTGASAKMGRPRQNMLCMLGKPRSRKFGLESPGLAIISHRHHDPCTHCIVDLERLVFGEVEQLIEHCLDDSGIPVYLTGHCPLEYCSTCFVHIDVEPEACIGPNVSLSIAIEFCRSLIHVECLMQIVISV